jgi:riboflavin biosynthesis pyrimidine reductase
MMGARLPGTVVRPPRSSIAPFEVLLDHAQGLTVPLPKSLRSVYGTLRLRRPEDVPAVFANFASTLDGVVAFDGSGEAPGRAITGPDPHDRFLMALLRASVDAVVVGAGTVRASPRHVWTASHAYPGGRAEFAELRHRLNLPPSPPTFVVSAAGRVDPGWGLFSSAETPAIVVTTEAGARRIAREAGSQHLAVLVAGSSTHLRAGAILQAIRGSSPVRRVLLEGGSELMGHFLAGNRVDELFLTLAPQIAGRTAADPRRGLAEGHLFLPDRPVWGCLVGVRRGGTLTFLRTSFRGNPPEKLPRPRGDRAARTSGRSPGALGRS